ncbi:hypothetical protein FQR65_LT18965 [Abscondita terminalis]|nr:hypothetical protein FQR65_LT18965 [Abscondita terminalis]
MKRSKFLLKLANEQKVAVMAEKMNVVPLHNSIKLNKVQPEQGELVTKQVSITPTDLYAFTEAPSQSNNVNENIYSLTNLEADFIDPEIPASICKSPESEYVPSINPSNKNVHENNYSLNNLENAALTDPETPASVYESSGSDYVPSTNPSSYSDSEEDTPIHDGDNLLQSNNPDNVTNPGKNCLSKSQRFMATMLSKNQDYLKKLRIKAEVFDIMRPDEISAVAKNDPLICLYGEELLGKHKRQQIATLISTRMKEIARMLIALKSIDSNRFQFSHFEK